MDGMDVLASVRRQGVKVPVLVLTARDAVPSRIQGLDLGADDYVIKPVDLDELAARLRALVRRASGPVAEEITPMRTCAMAEAPSAATRVSPAASSGLKRTAFSVGAKPVIRPR